MNKFKEGDKVDLVHTVEGVFPNGKYKISNGETHVIANEEDLIAVSDAEINSEAKSDSATKIVLAAILATLGIIGAVEFESIWFIIISGLLIADIAGAFSKKH